MCRHIRARVLGGYGASDAEAMAVAANCPIQIPDRGLATVDDYEDLLGPPVRQRSVPLMRSPFVGLIEYSFILPSWPHLFWVVHESREGRSVNIGFRNQYDAPRRALSPANFAVDQIALPVIEQAAAGGGLHDGWDEHQVHRFEFDMEQYEGEFVWGLLQRWTKLSPSSNP